MAKSKAELKVKNQEIAKQLVTLKVDKVSLEKKRVKS